MPVQTNFKLERHADGDLTVSLAPQANISGWTLQTTMWKNYQNVSGSVSGLITKSCASGFNNVSGINVTNGIQGTFMVHFNRFDVSGNLDSGAYYFKAERMDSGNASVIAEGYRLVP